MMQNLVVVVEIIQIYLVTWTALDVNALAFYISGANILSSEQLVHLLNLLLAVSG
jgi:hypothetical protein